MRLGESISLFSNSVLERIGHLSSGFLIGGADSPGATSQAIATISHVVRREAYVMAYNDCFFVLGVVLSASVVVIWLADRVVSGAGK